MTDSVNWLLTCLSVVSFLRDEARRPLVEEIIPRPVHHHEHLVAEPDELDDVDDQPHHPGRESLEGDAADVRDRGVAADRGERTGIRVAERRRGLAPQLA